MLKAIHKLRSQRSKRLFRSAEIRHGEIEGHDLIVRVESEEPYLSRSRR